MFRNRKIAKKLVAAGSCVDTSFMVYLNNDEPAVFPTHDDCMDYIRSYRENNCIFKMQIYRIETYSL